MMNLAALLSLSLVAFTIELDNEFEHRMVHRTTSQSNQGGESHGPWLTSFAMYANCLRFLGDTPISLRELEAASRSETNLDGMRRWGYIRLHAPPGKRASKRPNRDWLIEPTAAGRLARDTWRPLPDLVEGRWQNRFGTEALGQLRGILLEANATFAVAYPDFLPILHYGLFTRGTGPRGERTLPPYQEAPLTAGSPLTALLSRLLCAYAYEFENGFPFSLAISANLLRVLAPSGVPYKELPQRTGVSKEAIAMAAGILRKADLIAVGAGAARVAALTPRGVEAQRKVIERMSEIETRWKQMFGAPKLQRLRETLATVVGEQASGHTRLLEGLQPQPGNWRASRPPVRTLPHFPMVLHRGGFPDGS
jgi:hypothetical protein